VLSAKKIPAIISFTVAVLMMVLTPASKVFAQQEPQFTHNMFNYSTINPGHYGMSEGICVTGILREQWLGFKDEEGNKVNPQTFLIGADSPIKFLHGGVGLNIVQDKYGFFTDMAVKMGYAYHMNVGNGILGLGVNAQFLNKTLDFSKFIKIDEGDPILSGQSSKGVVITDMSAGIFLKKPKYYLSFSATQLLESEKDLGGATGVGTFTLRRHYYAGGGYSLAFPAFPAFTLTPSVFVKSDGSTMQADFNGLVTYNKKVWGGVSYRLTDAVALMVGMNVKELEIGYAYDIPTSRVGATGSHEVMLRYIFKIEREKSRTGYRNTRYL
jgi:type IX secretion system PorP/SprF family membrane protein